jgi:hypothetical protein
MRRAARISKRGAKTLHDGLDSNIILSVTGDDSGKLWVLTRGQVHQWDPARARFKPLDPKTYPYRYPVFPSGFFNQDESGVHVFQRGVVSHYTLPAGVPPPIEIFTNLRGALWFPLPREDHAARVENGRFVSLPLRRTRILGEDTYGFQSDDRDLLGRVWTGATSASQGFIKLAGLDQQTIEARGNVLFQDREGSFWLGTEGLGLYRFRKREVETLSVAQGLGLNPLWETERIGDGCCFSGLGHNMSSWLNLE